MLEIQRIRTEKEAVIEGLKKRNFDATPTINEILEKDQSWRETKSEMESITAEMNQLSKEIGDLFKQGNQADANTAKEKVAVLKEKEATLKDVVSQLETEIQTLMYTLPNVPNELVKAGRNETDNEIVDEVGTKCVFESEPLPHWELAKKHDLIDFELGVKITGAGFPVYKGKGNKITTCFNSVFLRRSRKIRLRRNHSATRCQRGKWLRYRTITRQRRADVSLYGR